MKYFLFSVLFLSFVGFNSCAKLSECAAVNAKCLETPPTNETCQAAHRRWFYQSSNNTCEVVAYTGCAEYGFASEEECNACKCKK